MLVTAPTTVMMHPHEYLNDLTSIEELRAIGAEVRVVYLHLDSPAFGGSICMAERITDMHPRERPQSNISTIGVPISRKLRYRRPVWDWEQTSWMPMSSSRLVHGQWY